MRKGLRRELAVFETSSPSYVLMSSIDYCVRLLNKERRSLFKSYEENLEYFDNKIGGLGKLKAICRETDKTARQASFFGFDPGKIVISTATADLTGSALVSRLRERGVELEAAYPFHAVAMTSICDTRENFERLADALAETDALQP
jgi:arginine/lysine/ornithine decarboxylase